MRYACVVVFAALGAASCDEDGSRQTQADYEKCQYAAEQPFEAVGACTMLMTRLHQGLMDVTRATYYRGVAFQELDEFEHAKADFRWILANRADHRYAKDAKERLAEMEEGEKLSADRAK